jgi:para-nitrobenzyl esterase
MQGSGDEKAGGMSEDCLSLNVFVPASHFNAAAPDHSPALPVLVWIHGGANVGGSKTSYGPVENLPASTQGHILVAVNYRLGVFGYLALPALSAADPRGTSGNYGITDQQEALRWVAAHIGAFGGDGGRVTIMGQSSGGTNVYAHLSPAALLAIEAPGHRAGGPRNIQDCVTSLWEILLRPG